MRETCSHELRAYYIEKLDQDWRIIVAASAGLIYKYIKSRDRFLCSTRGLNDKYLPSKRQVSSSIPGWYNCKFIFFQRQQRPRLTPHVSPPRQFTFKALWRARPSKFRFWCLLLKTNDYAYIERTLKIYRALVILIKCLVAWWWTY